MNMMVRFKRACAVLAAGATLAGGLALLPTVAQAVEGNKGAEAKSAPYQITFVGDPENAESAHKIRVETNDQGILDKSKIPTNIPVPDSMQDSQSPDKPWTLVGWTYIPMSPDTVDFTKPFTADTTVFAKWDQANAITFIAQDPTNLDHEPATQTLYTGEGHKLAVQPGAPANYPGYTFEGWFNADSNAAFNPEAVFSEDATFVAKYTKATVPAQPAETNPAGSSKEPAKAGDKTADKTADKATGKAAAKDPAVKAAKTNNALAKTGADAVAPLAIAAGLCLSAGITLGLRRKLTL